jgi:hypothetical protein
MTLAELIRQYRVAAHDTVEPYFVEDSDLITLFNEAVDEAAVRGRLIHESASPAVCTIAVKAGQTVCKLHPALYEIDHLAFKRDGEPRRAPLRLSSTEELDDVWPQWRDEQGDPEYAIQTDKQLRLVPAPLNDGVVLLEGYRLPMTPMEGNDDEPEINAAHHRHLYQWVMHRVFSIPDAETFDQSRAGQALALFTGYFGDRPDADLRRITREDVAHTVKGYWP